MKKLYKGGSKIKPMKSRKLPHPKRQIKYRLGTGGSSRVQKSSIARDKSEVLPPSQPSQSVVPKVTKKVRQDASHKLEVAVNALEETVGKHQILSSALPVGSRLRRYLDRASYQTLLNRTREDDVCDDTQYDRQACHLIELKAGRVLDENTALKKTLDAIEQAERGRIVDQHVIDKAHNTLAHIYRDIIRRRTRVPSARTIKRTKSLGSLPHAKQTRRAASAAVPDARRLAFLDYLEGEYDKKFDSVGRRRRSPSQGIAARERFGLFTSYYG